MLYENNEPYRQKQYQWQFVVKIESQDDEWISDFCEHVAIETFADYTCLTGSVNDMAAIYGLITGLRDMSNTIFYLEVKLIIK